MENKMSKYEIQCGSCGHRKFELHYTIVDGVKSIIATCECGRMVEYRGIEKAIEMLLNIGGQQ